MTLSVFVMGVLFSLYANMIKKDHAQARIETAQSAMLFLSQFFQHEIRSAGYLGCGRFTADFPLINHTSDPFIPFLKEGEGWTVQGGSQAYSNVIAWQHAFEVDVTSNETFHPDEKVIISDCQKAEIVAIQWVRRYEGHQYLMLQHSLQYSYGSQAEVHHLQKNSYFVAKTRRCQAGECESALYQRNIHGHTMELLAGIQQFEWIQEDSIYTLTFQLTDVASPFSFRVTTL